MSKFSLETIREIWNDKHGWRIEVGPDREALDMVEIRLVNQEGKVEQRISMPVECARLVAHAMALSVDEVEVLSRINTERA